MVSRRRSAHSSARFSTSAAAPDADSRRSSSFITETCNYRMDPTELSAGQRTQTRLAERLSPLSARR